MVKTAILCVDDERVILESLKEQLRRLFNDQYLYEIAESAEEALEVIKELQAENITVLVIVSDWLMPEMKGDEFLIEVHKKFPDIVTVMLTGQADEAAIERAKQQGNLHFYLSKPWTEKDLLQMINSALK